MTAEMRNGPKASMPSTGLAAGEALFTTDRHTLHAALEGGGTVVVVVAIDDLQALLGAGVSPSQDYVLVHDASADGVKEKKILVSELLTGMGGVSSSQLGQPNGVATLGADGKVPTSQLNAAAAPTEGLWTPQYGTTGTDFGSITYETTFTKGTYIRIGNLVFICGYIRTEALTPGSASGNIVLKNLPFPVYNPSPGTAGRAALTVGSVSGFTNSPIRGLIDFNSSAIYLIKVGEAYMVPSDLATGGNSNILVFSAMYKAA